MSNIEFIKFCNTLRCPLCNGQLDGNITKRLAKLYCVNNNKEYKCEMFPGDTIPDCEYMTYWYPQYEYRIKIQYLENGIFHTTINRFNMDFIPSERYKTINCKELLSFSGNRILLFRTKVNEDILLNKIKTYSIFS